MSEHGSPGRRRVRRQLSPEQKWEIFLEVTSQELTQADAARKWGVDNLGGDQAAARRQGRRAGAFASAKPGGSRDPRDLRIGELEREIGRLTEAIKEQAIELALVRGESR